MDWEENWNHENGGAEGTTDQTERAAPQKDAKLPRGRGDAPHLALHVSSSLGPRSQSQLEELCPPSRRAHQSQATLWGRRPDLMNNE